MKLCAIYNIWDGACLLQGSVNCIIDHVELVIIVYSNVSNKGEVFFPLPYIQGLTRNPKVKFVKYDPQIELGGYANETNKRNVGLHYAKNLGVTHFLFMDCDEYYDNFGLAVEAYNESGHSGSVCRLETYFKLPTLRFDKQEDYYVPFIHELKHDTRAGNQSYPFFADPTRRVNEHDVVELPIVMHHFSWCRLDIMRKVRNSSSNLMISTGIIDDYHNPDLKAGFYVKNYQRTLIEVPDTFGLSKIFA